MKRWFAVFAITVLTILCLSASVKASQRKFTYTYESAVASQNEVELELWTTYRYGRKDYYNRFDERIEMELGLTERLQTSLYLNMEAISKDSGAIRTNEFNFQGVSSEWKYKVLDAKDDVLGLGLYAEFSGGPGESEVEGKIILDKYFGDFLAAFNIVGEHEWEYSSRENEHKTKIEADMGVIYNFANGVYAGVEIRDANSLPSGKGWKSSTLFAGPTVGLRRNRWWTTLSVMPQITALRGATGNHFVNLDDHERIESRLLFGVEF